MKLNMMSTSVSAFSWELRLQHRAGGGTATSNRAGSWLQQVKARQAKQHSYKHMNRHQVPCLIFCTARRSTIEVASFTTPSPKISEYSVGVASCSQGW